MVLHPGLCASVIYLTIDFFGPRHFLSFCLVNHPSQNEKAQAKMKRPTFVGGPFYYCF